MIRTYPSFGKAGFAKNVLFAFLFFTVLAACDGNSGSSNDKSNSTVSDKSDAQEIIAFNNAVVAIDDRNNQYLSNVRSNIEKIVEKIQSPSTPNYLDNPFETPLLHPDVDITKAPSSLSKDDQAFFKTNVAQMNDLYGQIKTTYKSLYDYMQAEDFKDDNYEKGKSWVVQLNKLGTKYYAVEGKVIEKLGTIGDEAERMILKDNPLKDLIFAMKDDNTAVEHLNGLLDSAASDYKTFSGKAGAAYGKLNEQYSKHSVLTVPDNSAYTNQKLAFSRYYSALNDYLISVRKKMRDAGDSGKMSADDLESLRGIQETLRTYYNDFVD